MNMKIAIDAHAIGQNLAGNGVYTFNLVCSLVRCFPMHEWLLYMSPTGKEKLPEDQFNRLMAAKPKPKIASLVELIEQAKKRNV